MFIVNMSSKGLERGAASLPSFVTGYYSPCSSTSRAFQSLVRAIGEAKSKYEEDRIIRKELAVVREKLSQGNVSVKQMREFLVRLIYCEMLGHDASFGYVEAVKFAQQPKILDKRIGYLASYLFLHENHELIVLLINTLQKDLQSTNVLEVCYALNVACKLVNKDMMPALVHQVLDLLKSQRDIVRKKAVVALQCFHAKHSSAIPDVRELAKKAVCDKDLGVIGAALHLYYDLIIANPADYVEMVPVFTKLQQLILEGKVPQENEYHGVRSPWIQIKVLRILGLLGADNVKASQAMYQTLSKTLTSLNANSLMTYAVAYECIRTITSIYPDKGLVDKAARCVGMFLVAKTNDIKYLGITTLASLIQVNSGFATEPAYQRIVIDCLDNPDETLKRKTLDLLCRITNATNVETICEKLLIHLKSTVDTYFRTELVDKITELAERYAPDNSWYILTMNEVFELGGSLVRESVAHNLMRLLAEDHFWEETLMMYQQPHDRSPPSEGNDDEESDNELRRFAVLSYIDLLEKPVLPDILVQVISWVLGEYSYTATECDPHMVLEELFALLDRKFEDASTKGWIVTAIGKLTAQIGELSDKAGAVLGKHVTCVDVDVRQRCMEIQELSQDLLLLQTAFPFDGCCEDLEVDVSLPFLDQLVSDALMNGASPFKPPSERDLDKKDKDVKESEPSLKFTPYENPLKKDRRRSLPPATQTKLVHTKPVEGQKDKVMNPERKTREKTLDPPVSSNKLFTGRAVWGPEGYAREERKSGSAGESSSRSDSSSRSSGSEKQVVVKTRAKVSPSPLITSEDDRQKQHLAAQLFKGVTDAPQPSPERRSLSLRRNNRLHREFRKAKTSSLEAAIPSVSESSPSAQRRTTKSSEETNLDLLLDFRGRDTDSSPSLCEHDENSMLTERLTTVKLQDVLRDDRVTESSLLLTESDTSFVHISDQSNNQEATLLDSEIVEPVCTLQMSGLPFTSLPDDLVEFPHSSEAVELCCDSTLRVTLRKVWKPDELVLVIILANHNQAGARISDVTTVIEPPSNLITSFDFSANSTLQDECIGKHEWVRHCIVLKYQAPALHMNFGGKISYKDPNRTMKKLFFNHVLQISDLLRPLVINTETFGQLWSEASFEKKQKLSSTVRSCNEVAEKTEKCLRLHSVEIIGTKMIAAGTVMESGTFLLHSNCASDTLELSVKSNNTLLNDAVMRQCVSVFT